jgi:DNA-binding LacI/PurR family transcriptional regulator
MTNQQILRVCVEAGVSPPTVRKWLAGKPGAEQVRERIRAAVASLGLDAPQAERVQREG